MNPLVKNIYIRMLYTKDIMRRPALDNCHSTEDVRDRYVKYYDLMSIKHIKKHMKDLIAGKRC